MRGINLDKTMQPLTDIERTLAEKYHYVIANVLHAHRIFEAVYDDVYSEVVIWYLNAVQNYTARKELQQYSFVTIATRAIDGAIKNYWTKHYKHPQALSLDVAMTDSETSCFYRGFVGSFK